MPEAMQEEGLSLGEKVTAIISGPARGLLPSRAQVSIWGLEAAAYMSTSSRIFGGLYTLYTATSFLGKAFGVDIDPTPGDTASWIGILVGIDTVVREIGMLGVRYFSHTATGFDPFGEPVWQMIDIKRNEEWYAANRYD